MDTSDLDEQLNQLANKIELDPKTAPDGLVKLVLSLLNTIKELMEKQALKRINQDELSEEQIENVGATFLALDEKFDELKEHFNLTSEDLEIDLNRFFKAD